MRKILIRPLMLTIAAMMLVSTGASANPTLVAETERVYFATGCEEGTGGTCNSTAYWLGLSPGQSSVGSIPQTTTPWNWLFGAAGTEIVYAEYTTGSDLAPTYVLRTDEPIRGQVAVRGYGGTLLTADSTVTVELRAQRQTASGTWQSTTLGTARVNKPLAAGTGNSFYEFEMALPASRENEVIRNLQATLWFKGVHVLTSGFVDGQGQSWFDLPYYVEALEES